VSSGVVAASPGIALFLAAHVPVGVAFALLLSAGFAGVAAFPHERRSWAVGYVAGANALAWIVVNPIVGVLTDRISWRAAQVVPAALALLALLGARYAPGAGRTQDAPALRELFAGSSSRLWITTELIAYGAWTSVLTFSGAFFIEVGGVAQAVVGWFLAAGAAAYFVASTRSGPLSRLTIRKRMIAGSAVAMGVLIAAMLNVSTSAAVAVALFCGVGLMAGVRTPASSALGLDQLPDRPGAMMAARTAATQLGYMLGALIGGLVIQAASYGLLGFVLAGGMVLSAWIVLRVDDPLEVRSP
jgi:predicted MFS family arabinose efflux permease